MIDPICARRAPALVAAVVLAFSAASAQAQQASTAVPPGMGALPSVPKVALTEASARSAIDVHATLRAKYGDRIAPTSEALGLVEGSAAVADIQSVIAAGGFENPLEWQNALTNVALAYGFLDRGHGAELDRQLAELEANPEIPPAYKEQLREMLRSMRPSEGNLAVVKALLADPAYGEKLQALAK